MSTPYYHYLPEEDQGKNQERNFLVINGLMAEKVRDLSLGKVTSLISILEYHARINDALDEDSWKEIVDSPLVHKVWEHG